MKDQPRHSRVIALIGLAQAVTLLMGLVRWKVVALLLGPGGVGVASVVDQLSQIALSLGSFGIPIVALRFLSLARDKEPAAFGGLYRSLLRAVLAGTAAASVIALLVAAFAPAVVGHSLTTYLPALVFGLAAVPLMAASTFLKAVLASMSRYRDGAFTMAAGSIALALAAYLGVRLGGLTGMFGGLAAASLLLALIMRSLVRRSDIAHGVDGPATLRALTQEHPEAVRLAGTLYVIACSTALTYGITRFTILRHNGEAAAGLLAAALAIATGMRVVLNEATTQYLMPVVSRPTSTIVRANETMAYLKSLSAMLLLAALPLCLFPREVLTVLYSSRFTGAATVFGLFVLSEALLTLTCVFQVLFIGLDDRRGYLINLLGGQALIILGVSTLVPSMGLSAAAASHLLGAFATLVLFGSRTRRIHHVPWSWRTSVPAIYAIAALATATVIGVLATTPTAMQLGLKAAAGLVLAAPLLRSVGSPLALFRKPAAPIPPADAPNLP